MLENLTKEFWMIHKSDFKDCDPVWIAKQFYYCHSLGLDENPFHEIRQKEKHEKFKVKMISLQKMGKSKHE